MPDEVFLSPDNGDCPQHTSAGPNPLIRVFEGESSGVTSTGSFNLSQGDGNTWTNAATAGAWGSVLPFPAVVEAVTFGARRNPADGSSYQLYHRAAGAGQVTNPIGSVMTMAGGDLELVVTGLSLALAAGDAVNIRTVEGGARDIVGCVWGRFQGVTT